VAKGDVIALTSSRERSGAGSNGYVMLAALLVAIGLQFYGGFNIVNDHQGAGPIASLIAGTLLLLLVAPGFYMLQPNQATAITLFGDYRGTDRTTGLRWTWPWMIKKKVSVRANNFISERIKVNDLRGNPIEMAAQIVWRVFDTAQALFAMFGGFALLVLVASGFYMLQPNQAVAITLFGDYRGSDRTTGLRWTWPWMIKKKISVRANNFISDRIKVNDLRGNPIEMAAQIVWRVIDSAQALFDVVDYHAFVRVQVEAAIRTIGSRYPYDDFEHLEITLRGNHDEVGAELRKELQARLLVAGITVDECGFTHLAYAQEIAGAMLRRQQAQAVVAARKTLVEGAVGMVEMALAMLSEKNVVELDDERRAAMVSNLMVVLCGERDTQPGVNTGTLYT
jgi:regulator of protease activity HflC (stomatin/prohibitin superfamily)